MRTSSQASREVGKEEGRGGGEVGKKKKKKKHCHGYKNQFPEAEIHIKSYLTFKKLCSRLFRRFLFCFVFLSIILQETSESSNGVWQCCGEDVAEIVGGTAGLAWGTFTLANVRSCAFRYQNRIESCE